MEAKFWTVLVVSLALGVLPWLGSVAIRELYDRWPERKAYGERQSAESESRTMLLPQMLLLVACLGADLAAMAIEPGREFDARLIGYVPRGCVIGMGIIGFSATVWNQLGQTLSGAIWTSTTDRLSKRSWLGVACAAAYLVLALAVTLFGTSYATQVVGAVAMFVALFSVAGELAFKLNARHERLELLGAMVSGGRVTVGDSYVVTERGGDGGMRSR